MLFESLGHFFESARHICEGFFSVEELEVCDSVMAGYTSFTSIPMARAL